MTAYPEPPPSTSYPIEPTELTNDTDVVAPELPSKIWPWLIGLTALVALGLQTWALLGLLKAGKQESDFQAKITAWEAANKNRQEAIDTWTSIEQQVNANVDGLREQASLLQGTIDSLQKQRDQMIQTTTSQAKTLESFQSTKDGLRQQIKTLDVELEDVKAKRQAAELAAKQADASKARSEEANQELIDRGRKIKAAIAQLETETAEAEGKVAAQSELSEKSQQELKAINARIAQYDVFLKDRLAIAAKLKLQQEKSAELVTELKDAETKLAAQQAEIAKSTSELGALQKQVAAIVSDRDKNQREVSAAQAELKKAESDLAALRKSEQELVTRIGDMSKAINSVTTEATQSLTKMTETAAETIKEIAQKATEVREAIRDMQVPAMPASDPKPAEPSVTPNDPPSDNSTGDGAE